MDFQDILFLLIFFIFSILPKKKKAYVLDEDLDDQTDVVRKKIEALKRKRNKTGLDNETHAEIIKQNTCLDTKRKEFSAYKHSLPVYTPPIYECESQAIAQKPIFSQTTLRNVFHCGKVAKV